jgi:hypothetical protein
MHKQYIKALPNYYIDCLCTQTHRRLIRAVSADNGPCHVSGIFLPLRVKSLPLATIYEVKIPLRKWKKSLLQRNPAQMTSANIFSPIIFGLRLSRL